MHAGHRWAGGKREAASRDYRLSKPNARFFHQTKFMQDTEEQEANMKLILGTIAFLNQMHDFSTKPNACTTWMGKGQTRSCMVLGTISFPNQMQAIFFHQTKCLQDMDEKGANAKLVLGTISFPNQMQDFSTNQMYAVHRWAGGKLEAGSRYYCLSKPNARFFSQNQIHAGHGWERDKRKACAGDYRFPNQMHAEHRQGNAKQMSKTIGRYCDKT